MTARKRAQKSMLELLADLAPKPGGGLTSITISTPDGQSVTLTQEDGARLRKRAAAARKRKRGGGRCW